MLRTTCISLINSIFSMPYLSFLLAYLLQTLNQSKDVPFIANFDWIPDNKPLK